jgi:hypothetical protein
MCLCFILSLFHLSKNILFLSLIHSNWYKQGFFAFSIINIGHRWRTKVLNVVLNISLNSINGCLL